MFAKNTRFIKQSVRQFNYLNKKLLLDLANYNAVSSNLRNGTINLVQVNWTKFRRQHKTVTGMIPPDEFRREVAQYDPTTLLQMCSHASRKLEQSGQIMRQGTLNGQNAIVTHHALAELAMWAIRNHPQAGGKQPSPRDVIRLANNIYSIQDPFLGTKAGGIMTLVRTLHEQAPYEEQLQYLIPRHIILYLESKPPQLAFDLDSAFQRVTGLTVKEFMMIGFIFYAATLAYHSFQRGFVEDTQVKSLKPYVSPEKVDAFLAVAGADFQTFRNLRLKEERDAPGFGRYTFNPLLGRPVIQLSNGLVCVPVPRLLIYRITRGIYYDLLDAHRQPQGNVFADWFGYAFQQYIGILLNEAFGHDKVYPEVAGVDWVVILGDTALVLECRSGRLPKKIRSQADRTEVMEMIRRNIVDPAKKLPEKIKKLYEGVAGIPTGKVKTYLAAIVTYQEWYPTVLTLDLVKQELKQIDAEDFRFDLMSAEDIEWLLSWAQYEDPVVVLQERRNDAAGRGLPVGQYVGLRATRKGITEINNKLLSAKRAEYLGEILPEPEGQN